MSGGDASPSDIFLAAITQPRQRRRTGLKRLATEQAWFTARLTSAV